MQVTANPRARAVRAERDFYPTPSKLVKVLLDRVEVSDLLYEPCAGEGHIVRPLLEQTNCPIIASDIQLSAEMSELCRSCSNRVDYWLSDVSIPSSWACRFGFVGESSNGFNSRPQWVITNPPFNQAEAIVPLAFDYATEGVAMLLRLSYLEPTKGRGEWLAEHQSQLSNLIILGSPRPSFTGKGTDTCTTAWMVWRKDWVGSNTQVEFVTNWM